MVDREELERVILATVPWGTPYGIGKIATTLLERFDIQEKKRESGYYWVKRGKSYTWEVGYLASYLTSGTIWLAVGRDGYIDVEIVGERIKEPE